MKNAKKILSLLLCLVMLGTMFICVSLIPASAAAGDVFSVTNLPDNWKWYTSAYVTRTSGSKFTLAASTNKGNGLDNYGILACDSQSSDIIRANTTYRIKFRIETWFTPAQLEVNIDTGTALWSRTNKVQNFTDLASRTSNSTGGGGSKLYTDLTFDVTTPAGITGNQHFVIGIIPKSGNVGNAANLSFYNITITELGTYSVIDKDSGETIGTVYGVPGDSAITLIEDAGFSKWSYAMTAVPATIASNTETISLTYTYDPQVIQSIDFGSGYAGGSTNWHYIPDAGHVSLLDGQIKHDASTAVPDADSEIGQHAVTLANNYASSGLVAGGTYTLSFQLLMNAANLQPEDLTADIRFGTDIWTNVLSEKTIRYSGATLAAMKTGQFDAGYGLTGYTFSMEVTLPETGWANATRNILLSVYGGDYRLDNVTITTAKKPAVTFASHSLVLAEEIGLNFFMDLSALTEEEKENSYMTFVISHNNKVYRSNFDSEFLNSTGAYYGFTCNLSSVEMAETVLPVFHFGNGDTVTGTPYSVKAYINYVVNHAGSFDSSVVTLVKALGDYGHYMQVYLGNKNSWTAGTDYTVSPRYRSADYTSEMHAAYAGNLVGEAISKNIDGTAVTRVTYNLNFNTITYINVKLTASEAITASAFVNGQRVNAEDAGSYYLLRTGGLPISKLGKRFTITGSGSTNTNSFTVTLSGLSYIRSILNQGSETYTGAKNAMASLYDYYTAAMDYIYYKDSLSGEYVDE